MNTRPRLLFLCSRFPWPVDRGDRLRAYHLIKAIAPHADITLATFTDGPALEAPVAPLLELCSRVEVVSLPRWQSRLSMVASIPRREPFQVAYYRSEIMERLVDRLRREPYEMAFGHMFRIRPYLDRLTTARRFLDLGDSLAMNLRRAVRIKPFLARSAFLEEYRRVEHFERESLERVEESWVITETDRNDFLARSPAARLSVVPNGIDRRWGNAGLEGPKEDAALFLGNLTVGHNVDAAVYLASGIWPRVLRQKPAARLLLVGEASPTVRKLANRPGVVVTGFVPDLAPLFRRARLTVAPLRYGAGVQNKVLETMAAALPAVVTPIVNDPIGAEPGREILVADDPESLAGTIVRLLDDPGEARRVGEAGAGLVTSRFTWERASERFRELLR